MPTATLQTASWKCDRFQFPCPLRRGGGYWKDMKVPMVLMVFIAAFFSLPWCMRWAHNRRKKTNCPLTNYTICTHTYIYTYTIYSHGFTIHSRKRCLWLFHLSKTFRDWPGERRMLPLHAVLSSWTACLHWLLDARLLLPALIATTSSWIPAGLQGRISRDQLQWWGQPTKQQMRVCFWIF